ncbi:MAG TPA: quinol:cytochrome C oxidoreductase [Cyclobacteriaceae bacterium]|nr:quinol:cytochrome C oxidoreductase [Cyclobacteriaceae bacterium]
MAAEVHLQEERYTFKPETKKSIIYLLVLGVILFGIGLVLAMNSKGGESHGEGHASVATEKMTASIQHEAAVEASPAAEGEHHESAPWLKRLRTTLWMNNVFFTGLGIIGLFFVAIQFAAQAGWSAGLKRVGLAMGSWIPVAGILMLGLWFFVKGDLFHWSHHGLFEAGGAEFDPIINKKGAFFYWPLANGSFPVFFIGRLVLFFGMWYLFFIWIRKEMMAEDIDGDSSHWLKARSLSAWFLVFFAVSSSVSAWDWVMSIDTHWFSTMFGWYVFASWWVTGLAFITLVVVFLKDNGYLKIVNANHLHDLGKFVFAFSIFWTYIWFGQFLLIYYANIPEETVYFIERMKTSPYSWIFFANLILNFVLPFLLLMTRDAKRHMAMLKVVCPIVIVGHWFDFFNMVTPGVMKENGSLGLLEIGTGLIFMSVFVWVVLTALTKMPLFGKNHPMLEESLHHHI